MQGSLDGFALRIEDALFQRYKNFNTHRSHFLSDKDLMKYPAKDKIDVGQVVLDPHTASISLSGQMPAQLGVRKQLAFLSRRPLLPTFRAWR